MPKKIKEKEVRFFSEEVELRSEEENKMIIEGYPVVFNKPATHNFFGEEYTEVIDRDVFKNCKMNDVPLKYNHDDSHLILARTKNKSMTLTVDDHGLKMRAELIDTNSNIDIYKSIKAGLLDKMSFAFTVSDEDYDSKTNTRRIKAIDCLYDVSVVDTPFYDTTEVGARSFKATLDKEALRLDNLRSRKELLSKKIKVRKMILENLGGINER